MADLGTARSCALQTRGSALRTPEIDLVLVNGETPSFGRRARNRSAIDLSGR